MSIQYPHIKIAEIPVSLPGAKENEAHRIDVCVRFNAGAFSTVEQGYIYEIYGQLNGDGLSCDSPMPYHCDFEDAEVYSVFFDREKLTSLAKSVKSSGKFLEPVQRILRYSKSTPLPLGNLKLVRDVLGVEVYQDQNGLEFVAQPDGSLIYDHPFADKSDG